MTACPTCGQQIVRTISDPHELLHELHQKPKRDVYRSTKGTWHLTRTRNVNVAEAAVFHLLKYGQIVKTYSDCDDSYSIGPTLDVAATREKRKREGNRTALVYVADVKQAQGGEG